MYIRFVDIGGIVDHHCLNFYYITSFVVQFRPQLVSSTTSRQRSRFQAVFKVPVVSLISSSLGGGGGVNYVKMIQKIIKSSPLMIRSHLYTVVWMLKIKT